jgi:C1A family cysteine protease
MKLYLIIILVLFVFSLFFVFRKENLLLDLGLGKVISEQVPIERIMKTSLEPVRAQLHYNDLNIKLPSFFLYKPSLLSKLEDQGICGSCWAFATCNVLSDRASIFTNGVFRKKMSVQQVISCLGEGCNGGNPEEVFNWFVEHKLYTAEKYKYLQERNQEIDSSCDMFSSTESQSFNILKNSINALTEFIPEKKPDINILTKNIRNMKLELYLNGPFYATINVYEDFVNLVGDVVYKYNHIGGSQGGHAIEIIGFCYKNIDIRHGFEGYEEGYWICRNSWSKDWPRKTNDKGLFAIVMGRNECGIESRCCKADLDIITSERPNRNTFAYSDINEFYKHLPEDCFLNTSMYKD